MNKIQKVGYVALASLAWVSQSFAWIDVGTNKIQSQIKWSETPLDQQIQWYVWTLMWFLWIVSVLLIIYWGFMILTAAWDDGKVKKGKTIMFQAALWLFVIVIANSAVQWIVWILFTSSK